MKQIAVLFGFLLALQNQAAAQILRPPVTTVSSVDLQKYLGKWYEIAAIPQRFEEECIGYTMAEYKPAKNGYITVINSCETSSGQMSVAQGRAKVVDKKTNSKLKVTFVNFLGWQFLFSGDYWILGLGENYSFAVVGSPDRNYAWILSRSPEMTIEQIHKANQILVTQGYDNCKLITTIHTDGLHVKKPFCQLINAKD